MAKREDQADEAIRGDYQRKRYGDHQVLLPRDERRRKIFVDGRPVRWGEASGTFYLDVYAYDRGRSLEETVERYLSYLDRARGKSATERQKS